jgi:16S rRNA C967 or C1407 C5-methylase (RsmB/RsmF family)
MGKCKDKVIGLGADSPSGSGPSKNIERVVHSVLSDASERRELFKALELGMGGIDAVCWLRSKSGNNLYRCSEVRAPWLPEWIDVVAPGERPGRLESHETGDIYILDLSSTFVVAALEGLFDIAHKRPCILDLCAAPGGKGILAWRYLNPSLIIANEVIGKRTAPLISNYKRCRIKPAIISSCDPGVLKTLFPDLFQLVIVDAPCSGQSLVLKGLAAPGAFHRATIALNERRQRRIIINAAEGVALGGYLLYSTCTFSRDENEKVVEWLCKVRPDFKAVEVLALSEYRTALSDYPMYRLFPHHGFGAGSFVALLKRGGERQQEGPIDITIESVLSKLRAVWVSEGP